MGAKRRMPDDYTILKMGLLLKQARLFWSAIAPFVNF